LDVSTERAIKDAPKMVSGLVVKTVILSDFSHYLFKLISQP